MDKAAAVKHYAESPRNINWVKEAVSYANTIEISAEIKLDKILKDMEKNKGGNPDLQPVRQGDQLDISTLATLKENCTALIINILIYVNIKCTTKLWREY